MGGFSFGLGGGRGAHFDTWRSDGSSSSSGSTSRSDSRHGRHSRRDRSPSMSPVRGLDSQFSRMMSDSFSDRMTGGMPSMFRGMPSMLGSDFGSSAHSGFPGMPRGRRRSRSSSFDSDRDTIRPDGFSPFDSEMDTVRLGSAYSGFPGMPAGMESSGSRFAERSEPFFMRRTDSHSPSSGSRRHRSPSPPVTSYGRDYRTTSRAPESTYEPQSTYAPRRGPLPSPQRYSSSTYSSYIPRASSPPRRHRSPSPPPRRQHSPSPVSRGYGRNRRRTPSPSARRRADSARGFRTTECKPEEAFSRHGASSSSRDRSHSRAEQPSRGQYNGGYSHGTPYGTWQGSSNNAYNARPMPNRSQSSSRPQPNARDSHRQHARSPPPQPRAHARDNTRTRSASNASASTAKPTRSRDELKKIFDAYNTAWDSLSPHDRNYPLPAPSRDLSNPNFAGGSSANAGKWSTEQILTANVQLIFLAGFGLSGSLNTRGDSIRVHVETRGPQKEELQALAKWLSRKEQPRWHPDRMNARTGKVGVLDEGISKKRDVVAMRTAAQELLGNISQ